jgi:GDP-L-fucose synthase
VHGGSGGPVDRDAVTYVAGHRGLAGSAIWRRLRAAGFSRLIGRSSAELDLRDRAATFGFVEATRPRCLVLAAARVGGILANASRPVEFLSDNLRIQLNVLDAALAVGVPRLLFLGSSCIYPRDAAQPIGEDALLTGPLEQTNDGYAIAKIAGILQVRAVRREYGLSWISAMPANLYGPGDNFDPDTAHVLPALLRRTHEAACANSGELVVWGSGTPRREFLHADDLARACLLLLDRYDGETPVNVGPGADVTIRELAELVAGIVGYRGRLVFDPSKPDGALRKLLDVSRLAALGFRPEVGLADGIRSTYQWYRQHPPDRAGIVHTRPLVAAAPIDG